MGSFETMTLYYMLRCFFNVYYVYHEKTQAASEIMQRDGRYTEISIRADLAGVKRFITAYRL